MGPRLLEHRLDYAVRSPRQRCAGCSTWGLFTHRIPAAMEGCAGPSPSTAKWRSRNRPWPPPLQPGGIHHRQAIRALDREPKYGEEDFQESQLWGAATRKLFTASRLRKAVERARAIAKLRHLEWEGRNEPEEDGALP